MRNRPTYVVLLVLILPTASFASAEPPAWFLEHVRQLASEGGVWVASNADYQSDEEQFTDYIMAWRTGIDGRSLLGFMYGLADNQRVGPIWEFKTIWHPGEGRVLAFQFGPDGTLGVGPMVAVGEHSHRIEQEFFLPSGESFRIGHEGSLSEGDLQTQSYDIAADGSWTERRSYVWSRAELAEEEE